MASKRRTEADRQRERENAVRCAWDIFQKKLEAIQTFIDAKILASTGPPVNAPGRQYYSRLGWFLENFGPPDGSSYDELQLYSLLLARLPKDSTFKPGFLDKAEALLRSAMQKQRPGSNA